MENQSAVPESKVPVLEAQLRDVLSVGHVQVLEKPDQVVSFSGRLLRDADSAYATLRERFHSLGYTPSLQRQGENQVVIAHRQEAARPLPQARVNVALFIATVLSTLFVGAFAEVAPAVTKPETDLILAIFQVATAMVRQPLLILSGLPFSLTLMTILLAHEMGHYVIGRRYGAPMSLPYFIPLPVPSTFGTMGAVIVQRGQFEDRKSLFDIGVAGPLAGLIVGLPLLVYGLSISPVKSIQPPAMLEGNSILYLALKYILFGKILPSNGMDVWLNPIAWAAWGGVFITSLNLLPVGQLDGGHVLYALLGRRAHPVAMGVLGLMAVMAFFWQGWLLWVFLILAFGPFHPAPLNDLSRMDIRRRLVAIATLVVFVLTFTPIPFTMIQ